MRRRCLVSGKLVYWVPEGEGRLRTLKLTVCAEEDRLSGGLANLRRRRLGRIMAEAVSQGARLSYRDLSMIMLVSKATLKRDVSHLRKNGMELSSVAGADR